MNLIDHARIVRPEQILAADNTIVHFNDDEHGARSIELHGNARVQPGASAKPDSPDLQADNILLDFQDDGQTLRHAVLAGKARLVQLTDQGRQTISAATLDIVTAADGRTLTHLQAHTGVEVLLPASGENPDRTIRAPCARHDRRRHRSEDRDVRRRCDIYRETTRCGAASGRTGQCQHRSHRRRARHSSWI